MFKSIGKLFPWTRFKLLEAENSQLREKLAEKQEHINKTNAYWKRRFQELSRSKTKSSQRL